MSNKTYEVVMGNTTLQRTVLSPWLLREIWILLPIQFTEVRNEWI